MSDGGAQTIEARVTIVNRRGLHARASARLVAAVSAMPGAAVTLLKDGHEASGENILDLMMLGAARGDSVTIRVGGENPAARLAEIVALVESGFGED